MAHHVILGAGPSGVIAAETLRKHGAQERITLIGDEPEQPYSRMAIPYLLHGRIDEAGTLLRKHPTHYARLCIDLRHARAQRVDVAQRVVTLDDGASVPFDSLLIATGSQPLRPPIAGMDLPGVHTCWTLADARAIAARAQPGSRVLQLGAGFIGCIILEALAARGVQLSVVEMGDRMVPRMMGPAAAGLIRDVCQAHGVRVFTSTRLEAIHREGQALAARLSNGQTLSADLVISAAGVRPAIAFLADSGITCLQGVCTDQHLQTNQAGIFAAGDCAQALDRVSGLALVSAIQPNAAEQARVAALNMLAHTRGLAASAVLQGVTQINVLDTLGLISASFGHWAGVAGGEQAQCLDVAARKLLSLQFSGDVLVGANAVGWTAHLGALRGLVEGRVHLGPWKDRLLADPTQFMAAYLDCAQGQGHWSGAQDARRRA